MKKFIINTIALTGLIITVLASSCTVQHHPKRMHYYSTDRYHHYDRNEYNREHRYAPPRQY